jgi:hypothetical protein
MWYLRVVHSFDYFSATEHHYEDDMPLRSAQCTVLAALTPVRATLIHVARGYGGGETSSRNMEWLSRIKARSETTTAEPFMLKDEVSSCLLHHVYVASTVLCCSRQIE